MINKIYIRIICFIIILILSCTLKALAQDETQQGNQTQPLSDKSSPGTFFNIHIYPVSTLTSLLVAGLNASSDEDEDAEESTSEETDKDEVYFTNLYLTFEFGIINSYSIVLTPSYQGWNFSSAGYEDKGRFNHDRIGADLGWRFYVSGDQNVNGFIVQATGGIYYFRRELKYGDEPIDTARYKAVLYQGMGYVGYQYDAFCFILGAGYNHYKDIELTYEYDSERKVVRDNFAWRGFVCDASVTLKLQIFN